MKHIIFITCALLLTACDGGSTISIPHFECENGKLPYEDQGESSIKFEKGHFDDMAKTLCSQSGKRFSGKFSCDGNDMLAKCK